MRFDEINREVVIKDGKRFMKITRKSRHIFDVREEYTEEEYVEIDSNNKMIVKEY